MSGALAPRALRPRLMAADFGPDILAAHLPLPIAILGDPRLRVVGQVKIRRGADMKRHALLEPEGAVLPAAQAEFLRLKHMDEFVLDQIRLPRSEEHTSEL